MNYDYASPYHHMTATPYHHEFIALDRDNEISGSKCVILLDTEEKFNDTAFWRWFIKFTQTLLLSDIRL